MSTAGQISESQRDKMIDDLSVLRMDCMICEHEQVRKRCKFTRRVTYSCIVCDGWMHGSHGAGEVGRAFLAALVEEEGEVYGDVELDPEDVGLDRGAEADGGVEVDETVQQRAALLVRRHDVA